MKLIDGNKEKDTNEKKAVFTTGIGLYHSGEDFDVRINDQVVIWFKSDGTVGYNKDNLERAGFKLSNDFED